MLFFKNFVFTNIILFLSAIILYFILLLIFNINIDLYFYFLFVILFLFTFNFFLHFINKIILS